MNYSHTHTPITTHQHKNTTTQPNTTTQQHNDATTQPNTTTRAHQHNPIVNHTVLLPMW